MTDGRDNGMVYDVATWCHCMTVYQGKRIVNRPGFYQETYGICLGDSLGPENDEGCFAEDVGMSMLDDCGVDS